MQVEKYLASGRKIQQLKDDNRRFFFPVWDDEENLFDQFAFDLFTEDERFFDILD